MSTGFSFPGLEPRFRVLCGVDWDRSALRTYKHNHPDALALQADLKVLTDLEIRGISRRLGLSSGKLDVLHASPPCQPFSAINRSLEDTNADAHAFRALITWARTLRPKIISLENVIGMRFADNGSLDEELRASLEGLDYSVTSGVADAASFGVPQHRVRLFYVAYRNDLGLIPRLPDETHGSLNTRLRPLVTCRDAIGTLPRRKPGDSKLEFISVGASCLPTHAWVHGPYDALMAAPEGCRVTHHWVPALSELSRRRIEALKPGQAIDHLPNEMQPRMGYRGAYGRLHPDRPSTTVTGNCDHPSRGRFSHYDQDRGISLREAARLQSFPDTFHWPLTHRSHIAQQIGNAVPPLFAHAFASRIAADLGYLGS
jgi:DNA (cytosine-5)-methyltransferase 1